MKMDVKIELFLPAVFEAFPIACLKSRFRAPEAAYIKFRR